jgi:hypothetical protein
MLVQDVVTENGEEFPVPKSQQSDGTTSPVAFGEFQNINGHVLRTGAYLQWGQSEEPLGLLVMLNPGASRLVDSSSWLLLEEGKVEQAEGELVLDKTMKAVASILSESHPSLSGRLYIRNLFNLRCGSAAEAVKKYRLLRTDPTYSSVLHSDFHDVDRFPWIWLAWGVQSDSVLNIRKQEVFDAIKAQNVDKFLIPKKRKLIHVKHPAPQRMEHAREYRIKMTEIMRAYWQQRYLDEIDRDLAGAYELYENYVPFVNVVDVSVHGNRVIVTMGSHDPQELFMRYTRILAYEAAAVRGFLVPDGREDGARIFGQGNSCLRSFYYRRNMCE